MTITALIENYFLSSKAAKECNSSMGSPRVCGPEPRIPGVCGPEPQTPRVCGPEPRAPGVCGPEPRTARVCGPEPRTARVCGPEPRTARVCGPEPRTARVCGPEPQTPRVCGPEPRTPRNCGPVPRTPGICGPEPRTPRVCGPEPRTIRVCGPEPQTPGVCGPEPRTPLAISGATNSAGAKQYTTLEENLEHFHLIRKRIQQMRLENAALLKFGLNPLLSNLHGFDSDLNILALKALTYVKNNKKAHKSVGLPCLPEIEDQDSMSKDKGIRLANDNKTSTGIFHQHDTNHAAILDEKIVTRQQLVGANSINASQDNLEANEDDSSYLSQAAVAAVKEGIQLVSSLYTPGKSLLWSANDKQKEPPTPTNLLAEPRNIPATFGSEETVPLPMQLCHQVYGLSCVLFLQLAANDSLKAQLDAGLSELKRASDACKRSPASRLEELRNARDELAQEKKAWAKKREKETRDIDRQMTELKLLLEEIRAERADVARRLEELSHITEYPPNDKKIL